MSMASRNAHMLRLSSGSNTQMALGMTSLEPTVLNNSNFFPAARATLSPPGQRIKFKLRGIRLPIADADLTPTTSTNESYSPRTSLRLRLNSSTTNSRLAAAALPTGVSRNRAQSPAATARVSYFPNAPAREYDANGQPFQRRYLSLAPRVPGRCGIRFYTKVSLPEIKVDSVETEIKSEVDADDANVEIKEETTDEVKAEVKNEEAEGVFIKIESPDA